MLASGLCLLGLMGANCSLTPDQEEAICEAGRGVICDGLDVVEIDLCAGKNTKLEECEHACHLGRCVDCAPDAGTVCVDAAVHAIDTCGTVSTDALETCANGCHQGKCLDQQCTPNADTTCVGNDVYNADSCGNYQDFVRSCPNGCENGDCLDCTASSYQTCYDGDIYNLDSCMFLGDLAEDCAGECEATPTSISCVSTTCTPDQSYTCFESDLHYVDSCGNVQSDIYADCTHGCDDNIGCLGCVRHPVGYTCHGNDRHELLGGCDGQPTDLGTFVETCEHGCSQGVCSAGCTPRVGTVCRNDNVHYLNSCGEVGDQAQACANGCTNGACDAGCTPQADTKCKEGDVYWVDSCGNEGNLKQGCGHAGCEGGACLSTCDVSCMATTDAICCTECGCSGEVLCYPVCAGGYSWDCEMQCCSNEMGCESTSCTSHASYQCDSDGNIYWYDSCGSKEEIKETCSHGCTGGGSPSCNTSSPDYCSCSCSSSCYCSLLANDSTVGECTGCWDENASGGCVDMSRCMTACGSAFSCMEGTLVYEQSQTLGTCTDCSSCPDCSCYDPFLCNAFCAG